MEYSIQELEDIAAARLVRNGQGATLDTTDNLLAAITDGLLQGEVPTVQAERKLLEQIAMIGAVSLSRVEVPA